MSESFFVIYLNATDEVAASGTRKECRDIMGMSENTFNSMICRCKKNQNKKYTVVELEEEP